MPLAEERAKGVQNYILSEYLGRGIEIGNIAGAGPRSEDGDPRARAGGGPTTERLTVADAEPAPGGM